MLIFCKKHWTILTTSGIFAAVLSTLLFISISKNKSHFIYSLDDAYIHLAIAKNFALYDVWGVTKYEFSSSSSSILWTSLLAIVFKIFGPAEILPLLLNIIFAVLILIFVYSVLEKQNFPGWFNLIILFGFIVLPPLLPLIFTGLEHILHILVAIMFLYYAARLLSSDKTEFRLIAAVVSLGILLPVIRYEGIVIVAASAFLFILQKRFLTAISLTILPLIPIFAFGMYSISNGWSFFPNSLMLKGSLPDVYSFDDFVKFVSALSGSLMSYNAFIVVSVIFILFIIFVAVYCWIKKPVWLKSFRFNILFLFAANIVLYLVYARSGWSYRYQSFLVTLMLLVVVLLFINKYFFFSKPAVRNSKTILLSAILILFVCVLSYYGIGLMLQIPTTSKNIYEQQYQTAKFLEKYYTNKGIALNDIGTSNYFADIRCIDLWGLSNLEISKARREGKFSSDFIKYITQKNNVNIAVVYDAWFEDNKGDILTKEWIKAGEWKIADNIIAGSDAVSFYALNPKELNNLVLNLKNFSKNLPDDVLQSGIYLH